MQPHGDGSMNLPYCRGGSKNTYFLLCENHEPLEVLQSNLSNEMAPLLRNCKPVLIDHSENGLQTISNAGMTFSHWLDLIYVIIALPLVDQDPNLNPPTIWLSDSKSLFRADM